MAAITNVFNDSAKLSVVFVRLLSTFDTSAVVGIATLMNFWSCMIGEEPKGRRGTLGVLGALVCALVFGGRRVVYLDSKQRLRRAGTILTFSSKSPAQLEQLRFQPLSRSVVVLGENSVQPVLARGRVKMKTEPWPSWLVTDMAPPWALTMARAMARPMPVPEMRCRWPCPR